MKIAEEKAPFFDIISTSIRFGILSDPGFGSSGGMITYNTMQTFLRVVGMEPLHMLSPASDDVRRIEQFPNELVGYLETLIELQTTPRDIVTRDSIRNAIIVAMAIGCLLYTSPSPRD